MINLKGSRFTMSFFLMLPILLLEVTQVYSANSIRMQRDFRYPVVEDFPVYWNVPTFMCHKHGINFQQHTQRFGITANHGDQFRGDYINILYDPGLFPAMLRSSGGKSTERNGGIPQLGNLTRHLESFRDTVEKLIPANFSGVAIIDFESWRPVFRQNWNYDDIYKRMSKDLVRQQHPYWKESKIENQAQKSFEYSAKAFMDTTLKLAKLLRPRAKWGYYGFPYCYNYRANNNMEPWCPPEVEKENNKIQWLFDESTAIYPSIYLSRKLEAEDHRKFVLGRLNEAWRVTSRVSSTNFPHVYPYIWYKYYDSSDFLTEKDLQYSLETSRKYKMGGAIIWGATNDVITKEKCLSLLTYLNRVLGPTVVKVKRESAKKQLPESQYEFVPLVIAPSNSNSTKKLNYSYQVVKRDETSSPTTTSATPRLKRIADWYEKMLKYMFSFNLEYPKDN